MIIDTTEIQDINSFYRVESLKEVYGIIWVLVPILTLVLGITIGVLVIVWLEREISAGLQQRIGPEYAGPLGVLQALADGAKLLEDVMELIEKAHTEKDPRYITYISKSDFIMRRCEFYDRQDQLHRVLTCSDFVTINGYTTATKMKMENVQSGTWSLIETKDITYDTEDIDDSLFTVAALEKGRIR